MDVILLIIIASTIAILIILVAILRRRLETESPVKPEAPVRGQQQQRGGPRRAVGNRNVRARLRANLAARQGQGDESDDEEEQDAPQEPLDIKFPEGKIGTKKRAKLEAKAEKKIQRERDLRDREEKKKQQELDDEERKKEAAKEEELEKIRLEQEQKEREEQEKREHEEYLKLKAEFNVEEEGCEEPGEDEASNLLREFVQYIKNQKVVVLEDLASHFKMKTQSVIDRIQDLQNEGTLTGVIDDRGKFIYISEKELQEVAKFIRQRGRVSISELAENSNRLINLNQVVKVAE